MTKVAFIGLGRMGHGMAGRYLDAGFDVAVWNRSKAKADDLIARGAQRDFSGASFTAALRHKDAAYAVALAETLLPGVPVSRAALAAYEKAKASAPDDDEGKMIEIVSQPK